MPGAGDAGFHQDDAEGSGGDSPPRAAAPARAPGTQHASALPDFAARSWPGEEELFHEADLINEERAEDDDAPADDEQREGVADAPENSRPRRAANAALAANDIGDGDDMVGIRGVAHAQEKTEQEDGKQSDHTLAGSGFAAAGAEARATLTVPFSSISGKVKVQRGPDFRRALHLEAGEVGACLVEARCAAGGEYHLSAGCFARRMRAAFHA